MCSRFAPALVAGLLALLLVPARSDAGCGGRAARRAARQAAQGASCYSSQGAATGVYSQVVAVTAVSASCYSSQVAYPAYEVQLQRAPAWQGGAAPLYSAPQPSVSPPAPGKTPPLPSPQAP